jgi:hypothetical protein
MLLYLLFWMEMLVLASNFYCSNSLSSQPYAQLIIVPMRTLKLISTYEYCIIISTDANVMFLSVLLHAFLTLDLHVPPFQHQIVGNAFAGALVLYYCFYMADQMS